MLAAALSIPDPRERPGRPRGGRPAEARPLRRRALRLRVLPEPVAISARAAKRAVRQLISADVPRGVPALSAHPRMAGPGRAAAQHRPRDHGHPRAGRASRRRARACRADRRAAVAHRHCARKGRRESREFQGARNSRFVLAPGSVLTKRPPRWIVVADLVETSRLYGRIAARIQPEDVERVAGHLVQRTYSEPHWDAQRGAVMAFERVTLYGLPLVAAPPRELRADRARARPRAVHPPRPRRGGVADPTPLLPRQRAAADGARGAGGAGPPPRPARRRRRDLCVLRRAHPRRRRLRAALRRVVEEAAAPDTGPPDVHPRRPAAHRGGPAPTGRTPGRRATCRCR